MPDIVRFFLRSANARVKIKANGSIQMNRIDLFNVEGNRIGASNECRLGGVGDEISLVYSEEIE